MYSGDSQFAACFRNRRCALGATYGIPSVDTLLSIGLLVPKPAMSASLHAHANSRVDARAKKIWTNEDIPLLRQAAPISIFAENSSAQPSTAEGAGAEVESVTQPYVKERDPRWYAEQRQALQAQIDANDPSLPTFIFIWTPALRQRHASLHSTTDTLPLLQRLCLSRLRSDPCVQSCRI
jgi:hypothetical protein